MDPKYLGRDRAGPIDELDAFPAPPGLGQVVMTSDEVSSLCPVTSQPDIYTVAIEYEPGPLCIESKSLKMYLWHFRDQKIFCEHLAVQIRDKVVETITPKTCRVRVTQKARGGITIEALSELEQ